MTNSIWLEVNRSNGAILSYYLKQPTTPSTTVDYVEATGEELIFLNALEDCIFAPGMVATWGDLQAHRTRVAAANKAKATSPSAPAATASQQPVKAAKKASTDPMTITNFKNGFKPVKKQTQGN
jgi:hypothetical protein